MSAWIDGDPAGGADIARPARETAHPLRRLPHRGHALVGLATIELHRDPDAGSRLMLEAIAEAEATGFRSSARAP